MPHREHKRGIKRARTRDDDNDAPPPGYVDAILAAGHLDPDGIHHHITPENLAAIRRQYGIPEPPLPPLAHQLRNATAALTRTLRAAATGAPLTVNAEERAFRQNACAECQWFRGGDQRCSKCGCGMAGLAGKWTLATERCPVGRW